jgi:RNA polymerase sigma factor (TIGR02999 family)
MSVSSQQDVTQKLQAWSEGNRDALDELIPIVYDELHKQASRYLKQERTGHTMQTTSLINEAYMKLVEHKDMRWQNRAHFFAIAATLMRRILIDHARTKYRDKRGGDDIKLPLEEAAELAATDENNIDLITLDEALTRLAEIDEQAARVVELRYFADLNIEETAEVLHISPATVKRDWQTAKAWLRHELGK